MSSKSLLLDHSKSNYEQPALSLPPAVPAYRSSRNPEPLAEGGNGSDRDTSQWLEGSLADTVSPESEPFLANDNHGFNNLNAHKRAASDLGSAEQNNSAPLEEGRKGDGIANAVVYLSMSIFVGLTWIIICFNFRSAANIWLALHAPIQAISVALFTYGIATLQPTSQPKTKIAGLSRHQLTVYYIGLPIFAIGFATIYISKSVRDKEHYTTWHGLMGITSVVWTVMQVLLGGGSVWFGGVAFGGGAKAKSVWRYHRISGYALYFLLLLSSYQGGTWSGFFRNHTPTWVRLLVYVFCPMAASVAIFSRARLSKMKIF